jgi:Fe2+ or Zn2+ uptake regulation protein
MNNYLICESLEGLLSSYRIHPTPRRIEVLKSVLNFGENAFTITDIDELIKKENLFVGISSIGDILILFKNTGLIREVTIRQMTDRKRGRPERKFIYLH